MKFLRKNSGFTLVELMAVIVAASIVTLAATTLMLFGLRSNSSTIGSIKQQTTARMLMDTLENLSTEGSIAGVVTDTDSWMIYEGNKDNPTVLYSYDANSSAIYRGAVPASPAADGSDAVLKNVIASYVNLTNDGVLTFTLETEDSTYTSSVYCRNVVPEVENLGQFGDLDDKDIGTIITKPENPQAEYDVRIEFLRVLANQYKMKNGAANPGLILNADKSSTGKYFSEWYIGSYESNPGWNAQTPWCACFLSWGLDQMVQKNKIENSSRPLLSSGNPRTQWYASVDDFVYYFKAGSKANADHKWIDNLYWINHEPAPQPGDLIVFDWNLDNDPSHIGAVLMVDGSKVYTIEGNTSNRVGVRSYELTDPRILGYGVIDWNP